jgi:DNA polymerase elongation subunit (family B)
MSHALKIPSNSFFGYLGYPRSRWYSRECAGSITAYARQYIKEVINEAEKSKFDVIYGDTDSAVIRLGDRTKEDALKFMKDFNSKLPEAMELELEDFYVRGVFVGKKQGNKESLGAKKKYALITESGRIKIRGFELVRRDWSKIARETQRKVLETILKERRQNAYKRACDKHTAQKRHGQLRCEVSRTRCSNKSGRERL